MKLSLPPLLALAAALGLVSANTPIDSTTMDLYLTDKGGFELAMAARPMWHFATMRPAFYLKKYATCYPSAALIDGQQHGSAPNKWPDAGTGCATPGTPFPTYYVVKRCSDSEIRVIYSVYYQHDGFSNVLIAKGHEHDWERIIVVWTRDANTGVWTRSRLLMSMHSGYTEKSWGSVQSTFDGDNTAENNAKDRDAPKIYAGWGKHPNFDNKETGWRDSISQGCQREYRTDNWAYWPGAEEMVWAANGSEEGERMKAFNWGSATGGPWVVEESVCTVEKGGYTAC
ncbi:hypothetical protein EDC01DRAFT_664510, partial [Geopyxis carbonaria]